MSDETPSGLSWVDDAVFRVEKTLVTAAAVVMTVTVSLDILHRFVVADESRVANILLGLVGASGGESSALASAIIDWIAPLVTGVLLFAGGAGLAAAMRPRDQGPASRKFIFISGALAILLSFAVVWVMTELSSQTVCVGLVIAGAGATLVDALRRGAHGQAVLLGVMGAGGTWAALQVRQDYIWSQELSLILLSWMAFLGGSMATRLQKHISVDALSKLIPSSLAPWARAIGLLVTTGFCVYVSALSFEHVFDPEFGDFYSGEIRPSTGMPSWTITLPVLLAFALMTLRFGAATVDAFRNPRVVERGIH